MLRRDESAHRWAAATVASIGAAEYQLAAGVPVMPIGGFGGADPYPTLERFQEFVSRGDVHYFLESGSGGPGDWGRGQDSEGSKITRWVRQSFAGVRIGDTTVYDLASARSGG